MIINWKRPRNVEAIISALQDQSVACDITLCDCHPEPEYAIRDSVIDSVRRVFRWNQNLGAYSRYVPTFAFDREYTFFLDDDLLPGKRCIEHFLEMSARQEFGVLGQLGRRLDTDGEYRPRRVARTSHFEEVDVVIRAYFVRTEMLFALGQLRWRMGIPSQADSEDDILLAAAMQMYNQLGCFLTPSSDDPETRVDKEELPADFALSRRIDHLDRRNAAISHVSTLGWKPMFTRSK